MVYWDNSGNDSVLDAQVHNSSAISAASNSTFGTGASAPDVTLVGFDNGNAITRDGVTMGGTIAVFTSSPASNPTIPTAISGGHYVNFSFTVGNLQPREIIRLTEIGYGVRVNHFRQRHGALRSQVGLRVGDTNVTQSDLIGSVLVASKGTETPTAITTGLPVLTNGDQVTLRVFLANNSTSGRSGSEFHSSTRLGSVYVMGDLVAVPEPASALLCGTGALLLAGVWHFKRRR